MATGGNDEKDLLIGWDTSTLRGTLAAGRGGGLLSESYFRTEKGHTGRLMRHLDSVLKSLGATPSRVFAVAVGVGPGNFTGVKVGVATAKAIAFALQVPLVGISTLDIIAASTPADSGTILATVDARRGLLYCAVFRRDQSGMRRVTEYDCLPPAEAVAAASTFTEASLFVVGEETEGLDAALASTGLEFRYGGDPFPAGRELLALANDALSGGDREVGRAESVRPIYLKKPT
jgi:tRNA threonylcarbamoyladenosine biosynthesis protein TsaB